MGLTFIKASIINPASPRRKTRLAFLVDSGTVYSVVPKQHLKRIGIQPHSTRIFTLTDGTQITREIGDAILPLTEIEQHPPSFSVRLGIACFLARFPSKL